MHAKVHYREKQISTHDLNMARTLEKQKKVEYRHIRDKIKTSEAGSLNKSSCLAPALGVTKFTAARDVILVTLCCAT